MQENPYTNHHEKWSSGHLSQKKCYNAVKPIINHPFGNALNHLFLVMTGRWFFSCFNHSMSWLAFLPWQVDYFISHWWGTPFMNFCESVKRHAIHMSRAATGGRMCVGDASEERNCEATWNHFSETTSFVSLLIDVFLEFLEIYLRWIGVHRFVYHSLPCCDSLTLPCEAASLSDFVVKTQPIPQHWKAMRKDVEVLLRIFGDIPSEKMKGNQQSPILWNLEKCSPAEVEQPHCNVTGMLVRKGNYRKIGLF